MMNTSALRLAVLAAACLPLPAFAHAGITPSAAGIGSTVAVAIAIPHGCDGAPVDAVDIRVPEGFVSAKPKSKPGWTITVTTGDYARAYDVHGGQVASGAVAVRWSGGNLPDDQFDEFVLRGTVADVAPGTQLPFVVTQHCGSMSETWDQIAAAGQDAHSLEHPAPTLTAVAADDSGHDHASAPVTVGDLTITGAFTRATLPNAPVAGGFLTITNTGASDDRLVSASSSFAGTTQIHEMKMEGDVMKMGELPDGLVIPAGGTVVLAPGGYHVMFMDLKQPLVEGSAVAVTLTFEKAGSIEVMLAVGATNASEPAHAGHSMQMGG